MEHLCNERSKGSKGSSGIDDGMPILGNLFLPVKKILKQTNILQNDNSSNLIGCKTGRAHLRALLKQQFIRLLSVILSSTLQSTLRRFFLRGEGIHFHGMVDYCMVWGVPGWDGKDMKIFRTPCHPCHPGLTSAGHVTRASPKVTRSPCRPDDHHLSLL